MDRPPSEDRAPVGAGGGARRRLGPLWRKAPWIMVRFPGLFAGVAVGALLLAFTAASVPVFLSASASATLRQKIDASDRFSAGVAVTQTGHLELPAAQAEEFADYTGLDTRPEAPPLWEQRGALLEDAVSELGLGDQVVTLLGPEVEAAAGAGVEPIRLLSRTGFEDNVEVIAGDGDGAWIASTTAEGLGVEPGDTVEVVFEDRSVEVVVGGIYRALVEEPFPRPYWSSLIPQIYPTAAGFSAPPPFLAMEPEALAETAVELRRNSATFSWQHPLPEEDELSLAQAEELDREFEALRTTMGQRDDPLAKAFTCFGGCLRGNGLVDFGTFLGSIVIQTQETVAAVRGPIELLSLAALLVALAVVASAGVSLVARRSTESTFLATHGTPPVSFAARSSVEAFLPAVVGTVIGTGIALGVVELWGPGKVDAGARAEAMLKGAGALPLGLVLIGVAAGVVFFRRSEVGVHRFRAMARVPWEIGALLVAAYCFKRIVEGAALVSGEGGGVSRPSFFLLMFPIAAIAGFGGAAARGMRAMMRKMSSRAPGAPTSLYLAMRRLGGAKQLAVSLVTACVLAFGVLVYTQVLVASLATTVEAKSHLFVGSDLKAEVPEGLDISEDRLGIPATRITRIPRSVSFDGSDQEVDLLLIDPGTFARTAYWQNSFAGAPLDSIVDRLGPAEGGALPAVVVGVESQDLAVDAGGVIVPLEVIATPSSFPGLTEARPAVVIDRAAADAFETPTGASALSSFVDQNEVWFKGEVDKINDAVAESGLILTLPVTADEVANLPSIATVVRTFRYLSGLGAGAGALAIVALVFYLQAQQRSRTVAYALSRRMGLSRVKHMWAVIAELEWLVLGALATAILLGLGGAWVVLPHIEPLPDLSPAVLFTPPILAAIGLVIGLGVAGAAIGAAVSRLSDRANFAEVLRAGG